jgi:hypothetical protein
MEETIQVIKAILLVFGGVAACAIAAPFLAIITTKILYLWLDYCEFIEEKIFKK